MNEKTIIFNRKTIYFGTFVFFLNIITFSLVLTEDGIDQSVIVLPVLTLLFLYMLKKAINEKLIMTEDKVYYTDGSNEQEVFIKRIKKIEVSHELRYRRLDIILKGSEEPFNFKIHALEDHFFEIPRWIHRVSNGQIEIDHRLLDNTSFLYFTRIRYNFFSNLFLIIALLILYQRYL
ncbi:hypothetical protein ABMA70_07645 [Halobacteriovorax sp. XZX-3]|uniref:hypothetical protein n=1 Tax=unclassified Halobacteriovorax TaxID=2639665 RepID=UPI00371F03EF